MPSVSLQEEAHNCEYCGVTVGLQSLGRTGIFKFRISETVKITIRKYLMLFWRDENQQSPIIPDQIYFGTVEDYKHDYRFV
jgi:hypothetical protein